MKKLSERQKRRLVWRARRGQRSKAGPASRGADGENLFQIPSYLAGRDPVNRAGYQLQPPPDFSLRSNYLGVVEFLNAFRYFAIVRRTHWSINLKKIEVIGPAAALVLAAEIDRWRMTKGVKLDPRDQQNWHPEVARLLWQMGFFGLVV